MVVAIQKKVVVIQKKQRNNVHFYANFKET